MPASLDGFRGIAVLLVLLTHSSLTGYHPEISAGPLTLGIRTLQDAGALGVNLFFFISGFVLFYPYARATFGLAAKSRLSHFIDRRFIKIYPSYVLAVVITAAIFHLSPGDESARPRQILTHLTFTSPLFHDTFFGLCGAFWTIGVEVQFYVLFPLVAAAMSRRPLLAFAALFGIANAYRTYIHFTGQMGDAFYGDQLPAMLDLFGIGMLCAHGYVRFRDLARSPRVRACATAGAAAFAIAAYALLAAYAHVIQVSTPDVDHDWMNDYALPVSLAIAGMVFASIFAQGWWRKLVALPPLLWLSTISYNLYLWQVAILAQCDATGFPCSGRLTPWSTMEGWNRQYFFSYTAISIAIAAVITYGFERPLLALGTRGAYERFIAPAIGRASAVFERLATLTAAAAAVEPERPSQR